MHESIIANKLIEKAKEHGCVRKIVIEVGDLAHLPASDMKEVMEKLTSWEVEVCSVKSCVKCTCGYEGEPKILEHAHDMTIYECPKCSKIPAEILSGSEIILKEVIVD